MLLGETDKVGAEREIVASSRPLDKKSKSQTDLMVPARSMAVLLY